MMTLALHREHNCNSKAVEELEARIRDAGVKFIYYQIVTLTGRVLGKVVPAIHLRRNLEKGVQFHRSALSDLQVSRNGKALGEGMQAAELTAMPDISSFQVLPWDRTVGTFFCSMYEPSHRNEIAGKPLSTDARAHLIRTHREFIDKTGLQLKSGCEPEMMWIGDHLRVQVRPGAGPSYHIGALELMRPIYQRLMEYGQAMGLDMIEGDYEDQYQLELNWMFDSCEKTADRLITYRLICRQVAKEFGVKASFMPKPFNGSMGNGCHHNFSLWREDQNVFEEPGREDLHLTKTGRYALGGLLRHTPASMLVMTPTANSFKRFWETGLMAPNCVNWGMDNKTCTVRLSANGRLEFKLPDSSVNPYLSHSVLLAVIQSGLENSIDPGEPENESSYSSSSATKLPLNLGEAIQAFEQDTVVRNALPKEMSDLYLELKEDEWARSCGVVNEWERDMYLEYLP